MFKIIFKVIVFNLIICDILFANNIPYTKPSLHIMLQGFNWESYSKSGGWFNHLQDKTDEIHNSGFSLLWLPPANFSYDGEGIYPHSRGYIPLEYYNLNSSYGNESELKNLLNKLKQRKIEILADLVLNHRGKHGGTPENPIFRNPVWGLWAFTGGEGMIGQGNPDTGAATNYAYDLDHTNPIIFNYLSNWMSWLKNEIGFSGFRYDYAKGFAGYFIGYLNRDIKPKFSVGEYWVDMDWSCGQKPTLCYNQDNHRQKIVDWIDSVWRGQISHNDAPHTFDFTTKGILQTAIRNGEFWRLADLKRRASGLIGYWPEKSVTFIDNHDTGSTQNHWPFGSKKEVMQGYAYILTHPGVPCVFWDHFFNWGLKENIKKLIIIRKKSGINSGSSLQIIKAKRNLYVASIDNKVMLKIGNQSWKPPINWKLEIFDKNWAVWTIKPR